MFLLSLLSFCIPTVSDLFFDTSLKKCSFVQILNNMKNFSFVPLLAIAIIFTSCGNDEPAGNNTEVAVYEATFLNTYPGTGVVFPIEGQGPQYFESFLPHSSEVYEETISWGDGATATHDTYRLELAESTAKLKITVEGNGKHKLNKQYTHKLTFTPGEYKNKEYPERYTISVEPDKIDIYENGRYYQTLPNPMQYTTYGNTPWEEDYALEVSTDEQDLSVTRFSETKVALFNADFYYEFNPQTGLLIQEKPESSTIGELNRIK